MTKIWFFSIMLNNIFECFEELIFIHDLFLSVDLSNNIFEFIIDNDNSITVKCTVNDFSSNRSSLRLI